MESIKFHRQSWTHEDTAERMLADSRLVGQSYIPVSYGQHIAVDMNLSCPGQLRDILSSIAFNTHTHTHIVPTPWLSGG